MLLLPIITGIILIIPGPECFVVGSRNVAANEPADEERYVNRILEYKKILEEKKRRDEMQQEILRALDNQAKEANFAVEDDFTNTRNSQLDADTNQGDGSDTGKTGADNPGETNMAVKTSTANYTAPLPPQKHAQSDTVISKDNFIFLIIVTGCSVAGLVGLIMAGVCWYKLHKKVKAASDVDYPAYGVTGPTKERLPSPGDRKLAQSAQMYHYQHQKQQMIAMEKANGEMKHDASEDESEEENEEGDYTVYECPGLAPTGEMEVPNPLFTGDAQTPVNGDTNITNGLADEHHDE